jgi:hypothetical protein
MFGLQRQTPLVRSSYCLLSISRTYDFCVANLEEEVLVVLRWPADGLAGSSAGVRICTFAPRKQGKCVFFCKNLAGVVDDDVKARE